MKKVRYRKVKSRNISQLVTPYVTKRISIQLVTLFFRNKTFLFVKKFLAYLKFIHSEKATKILRNLHLFLTVINVGSDAFGNPIFQKGLQN